MFNHTSTQKKDQDQEICPKNERSIPHFFIRLVLMVYYYLDITGVLKFRSFFARYQTSSTTSLVLEKSQKSLENHSFMTNLFQKLCRCSSFQENWSESLRRSIADEPQCSGWTTYRRAAANSLIHMIAICKLGWQTLLFCDKRCVWNFCKDKSAKEYR